MKTIYIDSEFKCHVNNNNNNDSTMTTIDTNFFDNKCDTFIEGYRFIPSGECWEREDGEVFYGEMVAPWKDFVELDMSQREYELQILKECQEALKIMGVGV